MRLCFAAIAALLLALGLAGCSGDPEDPETQIRSRIRSLEKFSREKDFPELKDSISEAYADKAGHKAVDIQNLLRIHHLRAGSVYVLTRVEDLELLDSQSAKLTVLAALAATPIDEPAALKNVRADVYRFDIEMADEGDAWRLTSAAWRPADPKDFF
jgi:hypothetical protein